MTPTTKTKRRIILASTSPRRKELFAKLGLPFTVKESGYQEDMTLKMTPKKLAITLSLGKAQAVAKKEKSSIVIGADTFVVLKNKLLGKPKSIQEAKTMLQNLSGNTVDIITGFTIIDSGSKKQVSGAGITKAYIKKLSENEINNYIASDEPMDKAGAFALQGLGAVLIKRIEGDFMGAMGLPLFVLAKELKKFGIHVL